MTDTTRASTTVTTCSLPGCEVRFTHAIYEKRKYCGEVCSAKAKASNPNRKKRPNTKKCKRCYALIEPSYTYCSSCWSSKREWQTQDKVQKWVSGDDSIATGSGGKLHAWARNYLLSLSESACSECGWCTPNPVLKRPILTIEHIDGDWSNNTFTNLKVLCYNCHTLTETFGTLNMKSKGGRKRSYNRHTEESVKNRCVDCSTTISIGALRCQEHSMLARRSARWPDISTLISMIQLGSFTSVGRDLGVSDNAVRAHIKREGYDPKTLTKVRVDPTDVV